MIQYVMSSSSARRLHSCLCCFHLQGSSVDVTPNPSTQPSTTVNITREYNRVFNHICSEIWPVIHPENLSCENPDLVQGEVHEEQQILVPVLKPSRESAQEALQHVRPSTPTQLASAYFKQSEDAFHLCILLHDSARRARFLYRDIHYLLHSLPLDSDPNSLSESQCEKAFDTFLQFDYLDNPFPDPNSLNFKNMHCFSPLNEQRHNRLAKSTSGAHLLCCPASCFICFKGPLLSVIPFKIAKKEQAHLPQLDAAAKGTYFLHNHLKTIEILVKHLYDSVESDKNLVRLGLKIGRDRYLINEVAKQLQKDHRIFFSDLMSFEKHLCICFGEINSDRSLLLEEISLHQSHSL